MGWLGEGRSEPDGVCESLVNHDCNLRDGLTQGASDILGALGE
jgi:hypothetical protein